MDERHGIRRGRGWLAIVVAVRSCAPLPSNRIAGHVFAMDGVDTVDVVTWRDITRWTESTVVAGLNFLGTASTDRRACASPVASKRSRRSSRSPPPATRSNHKCCPRIWRRRWPAMRTNAVRPRWIATAAVTGRSPLQALYCMRCHSRFRGLSRSRPPTGRRRCSPSSWRCRSPTTHTNVRRPR
jgi:hypothetical protein